MRETVELASLRPGAALRFLYNTPPGRLLLRGLVRPGFSRLVGRYMDSPLSRGRIRSFVKKHRIDLSRYETEGVRCYNDFFCRRIKPERLEIGEGFISPCDAKLTVYPIGPDSVFTVKGAAYSLPELLENGELAGEFAGGLCLIFRLTVDDYHRYCYFDDCTEGEHRSIPGVLHTVQPVAFHRYNVYHRNAREYTVLETAHWGRAVQVEVGALCVGKIANDHRPGPHAKGEEKGRFLFGGSTVILLVKGVELDRELLDNTAAGKETKVTVGETLGRAPA